MKSIFSAIARGTRSRNIEGVESTPREVSSQDSRDEIKDGGFAVAGMLRRGRLVRHYRSRSFSELFLEYGKPVLLHSVSHGGKRAPLSEANGTVCRGFHGGWEVVYLHSTMTRMILQLVNAYRWCCVCLNGVLFVPRITVLRQGDPQS